MSGTNKLVQSENAMRGGSESSLTSCLDNANEEAIRISGKKGEKKEPKKPAKKK